MESGIPLIKSSLNRHIYDSRQIASSSSSEEEESHERKRLFDPKKSLARTASTYLILVSLLPFRWVQMASFPQPMWSITDTQKKKPLEKDNKNRHYSLQWG